MSAKAATARVQHLCEGSPRNKVNECMATATTQVNTRIATVDHDRQGQAAHRQYKSRTVVGFASGKPCIIVLHLCFVEASPTVEKVVSCYKAD